MAAGKENEMFNIFTYVLWIEERMTLWHSLNLSVSVFWVLKKFWPSSIKAHILQSKEELGQNRNEPVDRLFSVSTLQGGARHSLIYSLRTAGRHTEGLWMKQLMYFAARKLGLLHDFVCFFLLYYYSVFLSRAKEYSVKSQSQKTTLSSTG